MSVMLRIVSPGLLAVFAILVSILLAMSTANAHMLSCGERRVVLNHLQEQYDERLAAFGVGADGRMVEVFVGPMGSWTILSTDPTGISCVLGSGEGWRGLKASQEDQVA